MVIPFALWHKVFSYLICKLWNLIFSLLKSILASFCQVFLILFFLYIPCFPKNTVLIIIALGRQLASYIISCIFSGGAPHTQSDHPWRLQLYEKILQVFSCEFWKIYKKTFFTEQFRWLLLNLIWLTNTVSRLLGC